MIFKKRTARVLLVVIVGAFLAACTTGGGGGGGGGGPTNQPPVADISADTLTGAAPLTVTFDSAGSTDPEATVLTTDWNFGDGVTSTEAAPAHTFYFPGSYTVALTVTDGGGLTALATAEVVVGDDPSGRYVATSGTDSGDCGVSVAPCATVNYAVGQAVSFDNIYVYAGTYPEIVAPNKDFLSFYGANVGIVGSGSRFPEAVVKGFRNPGNPGTTSLSVRIEGFTVSPQGDTTLISATQAPLIWLRGGTTTEVVNNIIKGAESLVPDCSYTCTTMTDYAYSVSSGSASFAYNLVENFRRPINVLQPLGVSLPTDAAVVDNVIVGVTSRAMSLAGSTGVVMGPQFVSGNQVTSNHILPSLPGGITVSNGGNIIDGNSFTGFSSGVYIDLCKKFNTDGNTIEANTFTDVGSAVRIVVGQPASSCQNPMTEGSGNWVAGGGRANNTTVRNNSFLGTTVNGFSHGTASQWGLFTPAITAGPIDVSCNWWGDASGPTNATLNPTGTGKALIASGQAGDSVPTFSPWESSDGGDCDGA